MATLEFSIHRGQRTLFQIRTHARILLGLMTSVWILTPERVMFQKRDYRTNENESENSLYSEDY